MNDSTAESGELRSTPIATAGAIGTGDGEASAAEKETGNMAADSTALATSASRNTGNARKSSEPLPVSDALSVFQEAARMLQEAGLPVWAVQLPVSESRPPRVAVMLDGVLYDTGKFTIASIEAPAP